MKPVLTVLLFFAMFCNNSRAADGDLQYAEFERCMLESSEYIVDCRIGYRTFGALNVTRSNAILVPTWFAGTSEDLIKYEFIGPGKTVDSSRYFVIAVDALSNGVSSSPSHRSPEERFAFPAITIGDMVESQYRLLTEVLDIQHLHAIFGISMGGIQAFEWVTRYPSFSNKAVTNTGTPKPTANDILLLDTWKMTIEALGESEDTVMILAGIEAITGFNPDYVVSNIESANYAEFREQIAAVNRLSHLGDRVPQLDAIMSYDVTAAFDGDLSATTAGIQTEMLIIVSPSDHTVNPISSRDFASSLGARLVEFEGECGHYDSICGREKMAPVIWQFLSATD